MMLLKNKKIIIGLLLLPTLLIAGCASDNKPKTQTSTDKKVVKKAPEDQIGPPSEYKQDYMYDACKSRGYKVVSKLNEQMKQTETYCKFNENMACPIVEFARGRCSPGNNSIALNSNTNQKETKDCSEIGPVCGENNHTYSTKCIADRTGVKIAHKGKCKISEDRFRKKENAGSNNTPKNISENSNEDDNKQEVGKNQPPEWLDGVMALFSTDLKQDKAAIKKCELENNVYYLSESNKDYNGIYDKEGNIICHPSKNINQSCPKDITESNCQVVWNN